MLRPSKGSIDHFTHSVGNSGSRTHEHNTAHCKLSNVIGCAWDVQCSKIYNRFEESWTVDHAMEEE